MNKPGWTALLEVIIYGDGGPKYQEAIHVLIEHGADVHLADAKGISPPSACTISRISGN